MSTSPFVFPGATLHQLRRALIFLLGACALVLARGRDLPQPLRLGIVGTDSSHTVASCDLLNAPDGEQRFGARVVFAYKGGSADIESSRSRVDGFAADVAKRHRVEILDTIAELAARSDAVMILSSDGRKHLEQAHEVFTARRPVFIDKPLAGSYRDAVALAALARKLEVPLFSSSARRFAPALRDLPQKKLGPLRTVISIGPAPLEPHHPDLYWYGVHPTESLFAVMGKGCVSVSRVHTPNSDVVTGLWEGERTGVLVGLRNGRTYNRLIVVGTRDNLELEERGSYEGLLSAMIEFFRTGKPPVSMEETLDIMAFMEAADESKRRGGAPVLLDELYAKNRTAASQ